MTEGEQRGRYSVAGVGSLGVLGLLGFAVASDATPVRIFTATGLPLGVYAFVVAFGARIADRETASHARTVAAAGVGAAVGYLALTAWFFALVGHGHGIFGDPAGFYLAYGTTSIGLAFGVVAGHYYVRQREHARRLADANAELRAQNGRLDEFASIISHDLRNPLAVASGYVELAAETGNVDHLEDVKACHDRIESLVDQVLALARMERDPEDVGVVEVAGVATDAFQTVDAEDADLVVEVGGTVEVERSDLRQVFENCYRNSVEHAGADSTITVRSLDDAGFAIEDDGPGIPESERTAVFERGYTGGDGTGLGLAIVGEIADAYDWTVTVTDGAEGGARFEFRTGGVPATDDGEDCRTSGTRRGEGGEATVDDEPTAEATP